MGLFAMPSLPFFASRLFKLVSLVIFSFTLVACDQGVDQETLLQNAQAAQPQDQHLADIYQRSCRACHAVDESTAPLVADKKAWQPRLAKGMDTLLNSVINGYGGMPPFGMCMDCNAAEFEALIQFMASAPSIHDQG